MKKNIVLILIIICLLILIVIGIAYTINQNKEKQQIDNTTPTVLEPKEDDVLNLSGFGVFFDKYSGHLKSSDIAKKLEEIVTEKLPKTYSIVKDYDDTTLGSYYDKNENQIKINYGIESSEEFKNFISKIKQSNIDINQWYRLDILQDTFVDSSDLRGYSYVEFLVKFKSDQELRFSLYVAKTKNFVPTYLIDIVEQ